MDSGSSTRLLELKFAELHSPILLAGSNLQMKLDPTKREGMRLFYIRDDKELHIEYNGEIGIVPTTNVALMVPGAPKKRVPDVAKPVVVQPIATAQVSGPTHHVFDGPGKGRVR